MPCNVEALGGVDCIGIHPQLLALCDDICIVIKDAGEPQPLACPGFSFWPCFGPSKLDIPEVGAQLEVVDLLLDLPASLHATVAQQGHPVSSSLQIPESFQVWPWEPGWITFCQGVVPINGNSGGLHCWLPGDPFPSH